MYIRSHSSLICFYIHQHCSVNSCDGDDDNDDCGESFDVVWIKSMAFPPPHGKGMPMIKIHALDPPSWKCLDDLQIISVLV